MNKKWILFPALACFAAGVLASRFASATPGDGTADPVHPHRLLTVRTTSRMPWNAVALDDKGRVIVSSPLWAGNKGPAVAVAESDGRLVPYPSEQWNSWKAGGDAANAFVSVNAIHAESDGTIWVVDTGAPTFGEASVPGGPKIVHIDTRTDRVLRVYSFSGEALRPNTYIDDIRINGKRAYLTDAGAGAIMVLNLEDGSVRRLLDDSPFTKARPDDRIVVNGKVLMAPDGTPLRVNADDLELSPDGKYFYFAPLSGPMYCIETRYLDDASLGDEEISRHVTKWFDLPAVGGTAMAPDGSLYFTPLAENALKRRNPDGSVTVIVRDKRLRWVDAPFLDGKGNIYLPVPQLDGVAVFNHGTSTMTTPIYLYKVAI
ncbi:L-dopachrome tautomerase-related protein [Paraburkholderia caffeinilytica]|uniref:L-dopachrome tautomerase-related protein n=1 Tax=Paraburkholderia caffeinilytica TaxID=1761016 RepID=UPI0038BBE616